MAPAGDWPAWTASAKAPAAATGAALDATALFKLLSPSVFKVAVVTSDGTSQGLPSPSPRTSRRLRSGKTLARLPVRRDQVLGELEAQRTPRAVRILSSWRSDVTSAREAT